MKWNHKPADGWTRETLPKGGRRVLWQDNDYEMMIGYLGPFLDCFSGEYGCQSFSSKIHNVIRWVYVEEPAPSFAEWWDNLGSGITPLRWHDMEQHANRVASMAWDAALGHLIKIGEVDE